jgi:hypothetical protein
MGFGLVDMRTDRVSGSKREDFLLLRLDKLGRALLNEYTQLYR